MNFLLGILLVVILAKVLSEISERMGSISLLGEFLTGLILGSSLLGLVQPSLIEEFATMGVILLIFLAGYEETDISFFLSKKKKFFTQAIIGLVITLFTIFLFSYYLLELNFRISIILAFVFGLTDISVAAKELLSTGSPDSERGKSLLEVAVVDTILGIILFAVVITLVNATTWLKVGETTFGIFLFFVLIIILWKYVPSLIKKSVEFESEKFVFSLALMIVFLLAFIAEQLHLASVIGAYFAGIVLQRSEDLHSREFNETIKNIGYGFFIPIFIAWMGLQINLSLLPGFMKLAFLICFVSLFVKFTITFLISRIMGNGNHESLIYGLGLMPKGADNLIVVAISSSIGILEGQIFKIVSVSLALTIIVSVVISSIGLKKLMKGVENSTKEANKGQ